MTTSQNRGPISDSQIVKMKYGTIVTINPGAGVSATHVFRANDAFDPDRTGVGHQPYGFDQWSNFYDHITVLGSRIKATFMPRGSVATTSTVLCSITVEDDATVSTSIESLLERTGAAVGYSGLSAGKNALILRKNFSTKRFFNVSDVRDNDSLKGTFVTSPADDAYYHINVSSIDGSSDPDGIAVAVEVEYICMLSERKNLVTS